VTTSEADYYRLRTEWLRFRSHLFDSLTGLPALPAALEEIRRLVEARGLADVVYLDLGGSGWQETKLGWAAYDEAILEFSRLLASLRHSGDLSSHDLVCLHMVRSDRFLVFSPGERDEGIGTNGVMSRKDRLMAALRKRVEALPSRHVLRSVHLTAGQARLSGDPAIRSERAIQQAVAQAILGSLAEQQGADAARREELSRMIARKSVRTVFHPIVHLDDGRIVGHEALTRPLERMAFDSVEELFAFAESTDLLMQFERLCRGTAVSTAARLRDRGLLFLNASAHALEDPEWSNGVMESALRAVGLAPQEVVIEITERLAIVRHESFQELLHAFKDRGYRVAVDDMGAGYASLRSLAAIEPDFLKFDVSLVRDIDRSSIKRSLLESLRALADKIRARVIAEGVEREEERNTLRSLGIELGQGFYFLTDER
jgi:EAL domain-containing protein (putative c-di-GMP-specific phosphodiesterase class I)/GGDEF domain-containing protein